MPTAAEKRTEPMMEAVETSVGQPNTNVDFTNNTFSGNASGPLLGYEGTGGDISGNTFSGHAGVSLGVTEGGNTISGNTFSGQPNSSLSGMIFACYSPNPAIAAAQKWPLSIVNTPTAVLAEAFATLILAIVVFAAVDTRNSFAPNLPLFALFIGFIIAFIIMVEAPLTMACINPARDLGPPSTIYQPVPEPHPMVTGMQPSQMVPLLRLFDGKHGLADVVEESPFRIFDTIRMIRRRA